MVSPVSKQTTTRIWDSLRRRYNVNPSDFQNQHQLNQYMRSRGEHLSGLIERSNFWEQTGAEYFKVAGTSKQREYARTYNRYDQVVERFIYENRDASLRSLNIAVNKRFGTSYTLRSIQTKRLRLIKDNKGGF